ncbi:MAG: hypothetical protein R2708_23570 [Vicinamibacterales bacterium]
MPLGYAPTRELNDGKFHKIDVKVKRRGVKTVARRGYWAPSPEEMTPAPAPALEPSLHGPDEPAGRRDNRVAHVETGFGPARRTRAPHHRVAAGGRHQDRPRRLRVESGSRRPT